MCSNLSHNYETFAHHIYNKDTNFRRISLLFSSTSVHGKSAICCVDLLYFPTVLKPILSSTEPIMRVWNAAAGWHSDRNKHLKEIRAREIQDLLNCPGIQMLTVLSYPRPNVGLSPVGKPQPKWAEPKMWWHGRRNLLSFCIRNFNLGIWSLIPFLILKATSAIFMGKQIIIDQFF